MKNRKYTNKELLCMEPVEVYKLLLAGIIIRFPKGFFKEGDIVNYDVCAEITKYLIEEVLVWNDEDIKKKIRAEILKKYYLNGMLSRIFLGSPYDVIKNAYPGRFKPWELNMAPSKFWNLDTAKEATIWMIEERFKWNTKDIKEKLTARIFHENGLGGMLANVFGDSPYDAIDNAYPGRFKPWEFSMAPLNFWDLDTAKEATIWLIEERLKWNTEDIKEKLTLDTFKENGLYTLISVLFKGNTYAVIENAYPGRFKPWELNAVPTNYWNLDTAKEATIWLIEEKLKWNEDDILEKFTMHIFRENGLEGMLVKLFDHSPFKALENAYPGKFKRITRKKIIKA